MPLDCLDEFDVQKLFGFLSENLNFESLQDELNQRNLLSEKETKDYIVNAPGKHFRGGKIIKLMIKKKRCKAFVACLLENLHHDGINKKISEVKANQRLVQEGAIGTISAFTVTDALLQRHFEFLYTYLEPRKIADKMFEAHCITVSDHDIVTDSSKKYKRLRSLLKILKMKTLHGPFLLTLKCLRCDLVVKTLKTDKQCITQPSKYAMWIQHSFTVLQEELPDSDYVTFLMKRVLDFSNTSDIDSCKGPFRQKSKLLKILLMKGQRACEILLSAIQDVLKREDLILNMKSKSNAVMNRGKPVLIPSLTCLETGCLQEHEDLLYEDLEPIVVCDYLLEEGAVNILEHDIITETKQRQKQIKRLIEKLTNKKDCFHLFLHILQKEEFETILKEIENPPLQAEEEPTPRLKWKLSQSVVKVQDDVCNEPIEMRLTVYGQCGEQVEQVLYERLRSSDTEILGEALSRGQMDIYDVSLGSVVIRLRPVTDQAVQTLISAKENNKLLLMIFGILQKVDIAKIMSDTESLKIQVQVFYDMLATSKQDTKISKVPFVEKLVKVNRNVLLTELDPMVLIPALSKSKSFPESVINSLHKAPSRYEKVNIISTFVENGSPDVVNEFRTVLKDRGHCDILELLDPSVNHSKADEIRKKITSNYENILNEMQMTLAKETLSKCCGNTGMIKEKILPKYGNRKQRMSEFLRFILQDDHNVLEFEKMLKRNGLYELLLSEESVPEDQISNQDIEVTVVKDTFPTTSEGPLFDSVITLSYTEGEVVEDRSQLSSEEQVPDSKTALPNDEEQSGKQTVDMRTTEVGCVADTMNRYTSKKRHDRDRQIVENEIISIPDESLVSCVTDTLPTPTTAAGKNTLDELKTSNYSPVNLDQIAVTRLFVYLKNKLDFDAQQDTLFQERLLNSFDDEYVFCKLGRHYRCERFIKHIIRNRLCTEFVAFLKDTRIPGQRHLYKEIRDIQKMKKITVSTGAVEERPPFEITGDLLQNKFKFLYMELEPRDIADELFKEEYISINDHDDVTFVRKKHDRLQRLLYLLEKKNLYAVFSKTLLTNYLSVLHTMRSGIHLPRIPSQEAVCIQHNFTTLQTELPSIDLATRMLKDMLDRSNISDIDRCGGPIRQKSKLIKIILMKGKLTCENFVKAIKEQFERAPLVQRMERHNDDVGGRGKPVLSDSLARLSPECLQEHQSFLLEELEPLSICDLLFQERALNIFDHDKITETTHRRNQVPHLIEVLKKNKNDCFHYFLYILHRENIATIRNKLANLALEAAEYASESETVCKLSHTVIRLPDDAHNDPIELQLTVYDIDLELESYIYGLFSSSETFSEEVFTQGHNGIEQVSHGSIVIRLRPISDQAVQNLLNAKENNKLLELIGGILKQAYIKKVTDKTTPMRVRVKVIYSNSASKKPKNELIRDRVRDYKDELVKQLEPKRIDFLLTHLIKSKVVHDKDLESIKKYPNCYERMDIILALVMNGSPDVVDGFATALKDLAYFDILEFIDPPYINIKAERIRKMIVSNFDKITDEMQMALAMEALSECTGDVDKIRNNILPGQGTRKQRMQNFLRFILLFDHNVIVFEKMLKRNGLEKILKMKENVRGEDISSQNIAVEIIEDPVPVLAEGNLFESVITFFYADCLDELTVRRLFVFLKENLILDTLRDEFIVRNFFPDNESKEYVFGKTDEYNRGERFLKLIIKKKRCKEFVACMHDLPSYKHVLEEILKFQRINTQFPLNAVKGIPKFTVTNTLLQNHFGYLFIEIEPRRIADEMFQAGLFSISDHDDITDLPKRHKRLKRVLEILERNHSHAPFTELLESLQHTSVLETLQTERQFISKSYNAAICIQQNFTFLLKELPDQIIYIIEHVLTHADLSDITKLKSVFRQKAKVLKTILRNGDYSCKELLKTISFSFKRDDLIQTMEKKSAPMLEKGTPVLVQSPSCQSISCLSDHEDFFEEELEPIMILDLLFEERAVDILTHDIITQTVPRRKQIRILLDTVKRNKEDCFKIFLFILQNHFEIICNELKNPTFSATRVSMPIERCSLTYEVARVQGDVQNKDINVHLSVSGHAGSQIEHELFQRITSDDPDILGEVISYGQMDVANVTDNPAVLQLKPLTDDAVHTLLNAKANNRLLKMVLGILKTPTIDKQFDTEHFCQIRVQVYYAGSEATMLKHGVWRTMQIINLLKVHRNELLYELEPTAIISALSRSKAFQKRSLDSIGALPGCNTKINDLLSMVEFGSTDVVESFVATLKDLGYRDIVDLIDPPGVHAKAEDVRKFITSNYQNILDEMQITLANEILSTCIGNIDDVRNKISQTDKSRHQRMNDFLRFIVKDDHNVIEFAKVLKYNGLEDLLRSNYDVKRENIPVEDVEITVLDDYFPPSPDGVLFDSVITLAKEDKAEHIGPWTENIKSGDLPKSFDSFCIKIPEDTKRLSFTKDILGESKLAKFVEEIRCLARSVVLYKYLKDEDKKPGTVYVYEVISKYIENQVVIEEKDAGEKLKFFQRNQNLVKVILIKGGFHSVLQAKKKVYQKYKRYFNFERFYLQHESEQYTEVAKLSAHHKVVSYKQFIESVRDSIPLQNIENIVKAAVNRALSKERITELCFDAVIQESGNINSDPYVCRSSSTVNRLKQELMNKTVESVSKYLGTEICSEIQRHIETEIQSKFRIDTDSISTVLNFSSLILLETMLTVIASILNPLLGALIAFISVVGTLLLAVNVNSRSWRRDVANEIYKQVDENKEKVLKELSSNIRIRCRITVDHLKIIADRLEEFRSSIQLNDQDTRSWEES